MRPVLEINMELQRSNIGGVFDMVRIVGCILTSDNLRRKMKYCKQLFAENMEWTLTTFCYILASFRSCGQTAGDKVDEPQKGHEEPLFEYFGLYGWIDR